MFDIIYWLEKNNIKEKIGLAFCVFLLIALAIQCF